MSLSISNLYRTYKMGEVQVPALQNINTTIHEGQFIVILGPSGCGKTTLLNLIGGIDQPSAGKIFFNNNDENIELGSLSKKALSKYRRFNVGFVFQFYNLVSSLTALENVEITAKLTSNGSNAFERSIKLLKEVGIENGLQNKFPGQLSGGEQQRVSIARALAKKPKIFLADEPTGNLDSLTTGKIMKLLKRENKEQKVTMIIVTHNVGISFLADKVIYLRDGKIYGTSEYDESKEDAFWENLNSQPTLDHLQKEV